MNAVSNVRNPNPLTLDTVGLDLEEFDWRWKDSLRRSWKKPWLVADTVAEKDLSREQD